ncbi:MAG: hypothetical protein AB8B80_16175 [Marinicellaceae bacterium]
MNPKKSCTYISVFLLLILSFQAFAELPYSVQRRVDNISNKLDIVEKLLNTNSSQAKITMDEANKELNYIYEYYKGKFDENSSEFVQVKSKLNELELLLNDTSNTSIETEKLEKIESTVRNNTENSELYNLKNILLEHEKNYLFHYKQIQNNLLSLSSNLQTHNSETINKSVIELSVNLSQFNTVFYPLKDLLSNINSQYPDQQKLMKQSQIGADVSLLIRNLNSEITSWERQRDNKVTSWLDEAQSSISQTEIVMAQVKQMPAHASGPMVNQFIDLLKTPKNLMAIIPGFYHPSKGNDSSNNNISQAKKLTKDINKTEQNIIQIAESAKKAIEKQLQANRFPQNINEAHSDKKVIIDAYHRAYKTEEILRFGVSKDWYEKTEAHWVNDVLIVNTYQYIHAWIAHKTQSGAIRAYNLTFRKTRQSDGNWSQLSYWGVGNSYEILDTNINI